MTLYKFRYIKYLINTEMIMIKKHGISFMINIKNILFEKMYLNLSRLIVFYLSMYINRKSREYMLEPE